MNIETDFAKFSNSFGTLTITFDKETSKMLVKIYFKALEQFSIEQVEQAIFRAITECKFFPKPAELIEFVSGGSGSIQDRSIVEAGKVLNAVKTIGGYETVIFDDPTTMAVIQTGFGGWVHLCNEMKVQDEKWFRKDFERIYTAYSQQGLKHFGILMGRSDQHDIGLGYEVKAEPKMIGDPEKIKGILEQTQVNDNQLACATNVKDILPNIKGIDFTTYSIQKAIKVKLHPHSGWPQEAHPRWAFTLGKPRWGFD